MTTDKAPRPTAIRLRKQSRVLELEYAEGQTFALSWEFLRVHSPSAEVRGHHPSQAVLQTGKKNVAVIELKPVGHYALQIVFDDGHDTGLFAWEFLYTLCQQQTQYWESYLQSIETAGASRDPDLQVVHFQP